MVAIAIPVNLPESNSRHPQSDLPVVIVAESRHQTRYEPRNPANAATRDARASL